MTTKYPHIKVKLIGEDGNAYAIVGRCRQAGRRAGLSNDELSRFVDEAFSSDYDNVIITALRWFACY
ncbi:hypothetical protein [Limimaricola litoreus]|uniref:Uncharacterized protein n=1 Tax=Limimaricola litoreus TaxID=2955316 RepID=A0A9X2FTP3_9RHOB|nr:hypothetical protein [Limimaricola litoreus]MCP1167348.1 hypothetical protein [Limimaricola litoreus]